MPKWIVGTPAAARACEYAGRPRRRELGVVGRGEGADPRVKQLDGIRARVRLSDCVRREGRRQLVEKAVPDRGLAVHQRLGHREVAGRLALDEVAGDGERPTAEADDGLVGRELGAYRADRVEDRGDSLGRIGNPEPLDGGDAAHRVRDDGADSFDELDTGAHRDDRGHDVGEHDRRVDVVAAHRLERHLGGELGGAVDLEELVPRADLPVLGERASRLPHEPDRRPLDRLAPGGAHEERLHGT